MMRTMAIDAPLSMASSGSVKPTLTATSIDPAVSCWTTLAPLGAKLRSSAMPASAKIPLLHGDVERPERCLAAERAGDDGIGRARA